MYKYTKKYSFYFIADFFEVFRTGSIALPSCAYSAIRSTHNVKNDDEFKGYDDLETDDESS